MKTILLVLLGLPLLGAGINALLGSRLNRRTLEGIACAAVVGAFVLAVAAFMGRVPGEGNLTLYHWFQVSTVNVSMDVHFDGLAALMTLMVTFVASLIHLYSIGYMRHDPDGARYFCYLNLFVFAMLVIAVSDNLVFFYLGWEGVGLCSYALIGFWYHDPVKASAGRKALVLTRIGDVALGIALAFFVWRFHDLRISAVVTHGGALGHGLATLLGLLLFWAAAGKSAQLPLSVWLPDAMAGPTPVSALIHAATMVTAGVYLLMRLFPLLKYAPEVLLLIAAVGSVTALYASCAALAQNDVKRVLAYSTISQVAYMFLAVGAGDIVGGMFHLISHAFFKALLFLIAGCLIQALAEEQDIRRMGNLRRLWPAAYWLFLAGALSLSAFPLLGGFFSKDRILLATFMHAGAAYKACWLLGMAAALLTPLYTFRAFFIIFQDRPDGLTRDQVEPVPPIMIHTLWPLAVLSLGDGLLNLPGGFGKAWLGAMMADVPGARPDLGAPLGLEWTLGVGSAVLVIVSLVWAYLLYGRASGIADRHAWDDWLREGFYLDQWYQRVLVEPFKKIADVLWVRVDERGLDQGFERLGISVVSLSDLLGLWSSGRLSMILRMFLVGFTLLLCALAAAWYPW